MMKISLIALGVAPVVSGSLDGGSLAGPIQQFVEGQQQLLNIIIGKNGLLSTIPGAGPGVAAALRAIEGGVDTIAFALIELVPTLTANGPTGNNGGLDASIQAAIGTLNDGVAGSVSPTGTPSITANASGVGAAQSQANVLLNGFVSLAQTSVNQVGAVSQGTPASSEVSTSLQTLQGLINTIAKAANIKVCAPSQSITA